ncbi:MAG: cysteine desulfurase family protein [Bdellovibrionota bacterium]
MTRNTFSHHFQQPKNLLPNIIYLDYAASTPLDLRVYTKMEPWLLEYFGNSANFFHLMGEKAKDALENARSHLANILNITSDEITFTSSATESNNLFLRGLLEHPLQKRKKIVTCVTEHSSIASTVKMLAENLGTRLGFEFCELTVDKNGQIKLEEAKKIIDDKTLCVCVMDINNETGIIQNTLPEIEKLTHAAGALLHVDAVQGFVRNNVFALGVDYDSAVISSGKIYGPKGAAAFILKKRRPRILLEPQLTGGGHENGLRSSTVNVAAIVGFVEACLLQKNECTQRLTHYEKLEFAFIDELNKHIDACFYGLDTCKIKGILSLSIPNVNAMKLLENTNQVCASVGSACKTLQATASHVLTSMGVDLEQALASFRVSFGLCNEEDEVRLAAKLIAKNALELRKTSAWI